jgi:hypothetical protein
MSSFAPTEPIPATTGPGLKLSPFLTVRLLRALGRSAEAHPWWFFIVISIGCGWGHVSTMASRHLDHDEIFTFFIAQAPSLRQLFALTHTIDLHPPLSYLLVRGSFAVLGVSSWSCRLPFLLAFLGASALIYSFLSRLLSPIYGIMSTLMLWCSPYAHLATEARPYSLILCFTALVLVNWYTLVEQRGSTVRRWALAMLIVGGSALLLSHVLGIVAYGAFFAAEGIRVWMRRTPDWRLWAALMMPLVLVVTYLPLVRLRSSILFAEWNQASPRRVAICYWEHLRYLITPLALIGLIALVWPLLLGRRSALRPSSRSATIVIQWLLLFLFLVPLEIGILFARTGTAFFERYGVAALIPCMMFPTMFLAYRTNYDRRVAGSLSIVLSLLLIFNTSGKAWLTGQLSSIAPPAVAARLLYLLALPPIAPPALNGPTVPSYLEKEVAAAPTVARLDTVDPELPLVAGNGPTFLELDKYQDAAVTQRLYLLTNFEAAATLVHATLFEHYEQANAAFHTPGRVEPYCTFLREHSQFLALGGYNHPDTWLLRKLEMDGAKLSIVGEYDDGVIEEHQIYRVSIENSQCGTP